MAMNYMYQRTIINHNRKMASKAGLDTQSMSTIVEFLFLSPVIRAELRVGSEKAPCIAEQSAEKIMNVVSLCTADV